MFIKSSLFFASLFLVVSNPVRADYPSVEDEIETAASRMDMKPLLSPDGEKALSLQESPLLRHEISAAEAVSPVKLNLMAQPSLLPKVQEILGKGEDITGLLTLPVVSSNLVEDYAALKLATKIGFKPDTQDSLKTPTWMEIFKKALLQGENMGFVDYYWY